MRGATGTAFVPHSVKIARAQPSNFLDEPYIEAIHFSNKSCVASSEPFADSFTTTNNSFSEVSFFADPDKPECALATPGKAIPFLELNEQCATSVVGGEIVIGLTFEPRCMVVTLATTSRRDLFDQLLAAGRPLDEQLVISVNYTIGTELNPDVSGISANCQNSMIMHENYLLDKVLQDEFEELAQVRSDITRISETVEFFRYVQANTRFFQVCASYPTTRSPRNQKLTIFLVPHGSLPPCLRHRLLGRRRPAAGDRVMVAPPAPPTAVTYEERLQQLNTEIAVLRVREGVLLNEIDGCSAFGGTRTRICGIPTSEGPNPWLSKDGRPCRGNATLSARYGDFCGFWLESGNPDAFEFDENNELLKAGPWCR